MPYGDRPARSRDDLHRDTAGIEASAKYALPATASDVANRYSIVNKNDPVPEAVPVAVSVQIKSGPGVGGPARQINSADPEVGGARARWLVNRLASLVFVSVAALLSCSLGAVAQDAHTLTTWKLNVSTSVIRVGQRYQSSTMTIDRDGDWVSVHVEPVTSDGQRFSASYRARYDGNDYQ
jgi:hypothetical protein